MSGRHRADRWEQIGLQDDDSRLRVITDALPVGIAYVDQDKVYGFANDRFAAAYGLSPAEIVGKHADEFIWREAMVLGDAFFEAAHSGQPADFMHPARHADGRVLTVRTFLRPDIAEDGRVLGFYVCSINVTAQMEAEAIRLQTQKMDAVGQLASGIAHDFNNLLGIILGNLAELREIVGDEVDRRELVDPSIRAAEHGAWLTSQLLATARRQPLNPKAIGIEDCIEAYVHLLRRTLPPGITLTFERDAVSRPVFLDQAQFETAMLNLCLNARDAMEAGGRISLSVDYPTRDGSEPPSAGAFVRLVVADTGSGMSRETAVQAFEPFFTTKPRGRGTGLGLSMVYGFVRQSHGTISFESVEGRGTTFTLMLPLATVAQRTEPPSYAPGGRQGLVLLVDDNADFRRTVRRQLVRAGYSVIEAENGREALDLLGSIGAFHALVSDVAMPGLDGHRLAAEAAKRQGDLRIVLMSGSDGGESRARSGRSITFLQKPFDWTALMRAIESRMEDGPSSHASPKIDSSAWEADVRR